MTRLILCMAMPALLACTAHAQDFQPYARPGISETEWQTYLSTVQASHRDSEERVAEQHLLTYVDEARGIQWAFTTLGHPAHPSWIARRVVGDAGQQRIQQVGYYAGSEQAFETWFGAVLQLTRQREGAQRPRGRP